jgi:ATP-dependent RNA helicase HelY
VTSAGDEQRGFSLDPFQVEAIAALDAGRSVLVCAPTGSGKTVVAEHAVAQALRDGTRAFYTTPIKALSNQKHRDLAALHGADRVGLVTGDLSIAPEAPIVVMTTEVLRNMLYADSAALTGLGVVVLDEVHYLEDRERGAVWEEVLIHTPRDVRFVCLSATVSNAEELAAWLTTVRGPTEVVVEHRRPVTLRNRYLAARRSGGLEEIPVLTRGRPNPRGEEFDAAPRGGPRQARPPRGRWAVPRRAEVVSLLADTERLPAIVFVFSRAGCDEAARALAGSGLRLTDASEAAAIRDVVERSCTGISAADRVVLEHARFVEGLTAGIAAHHAGMVPAHKVAVEECFARGLVKVVFATETLALGINMPARSVVIEQLSRYRGSGHEMLTPGEYTQLTGRAGRRGLDPVGDAIVLWSPYVPFAEIAELVASREYHLRSAFCPTYNMVVNLVAGHSPDAARELLGRSFAQFQRATRLAELRRRVRSIEGELKRLRGARPSRRDPTRIAAVRSRLAAANADLEAGQDSLAERFGRMLTVLERWEALDGWALTDRGRQLARVTHECDLLLVTALGDGLFDGLTPPELAGVLSMLTYEHRSRNPAPEPWFATEAMAAAAAGLERRGAALEADERRHGLPTSRLPDATLVAVVHGWASGHDLAEVLDDELGSPGDFVRNVRRLVDVCGQVAVASNVPATARVARQAADLLSRGIVAAGQVETGALPSDAAAVADVTGPAT